MEQSPSGEANRFAASQELPPIWWSPKVHYRIRKCPPPVYPEPAQSSPYPHIPLPEDRSDYPPIYAWVSPVVSFPQVSPPKPCIIIIIIIIIIKVEIKKPNTCNVKLLSERLSSLLNCYCQMTFECRAPIWKNWKIYTRSNFCRVVCDIKLLHAIRRGASCNICAILRWYGT
jgi:hypothetical protein